MRLDLLITTALFFNEI